MVLQEVESGKDTTNISILEGASTLLEARPQLQIDKIKTTDIRAGAGSYQTEQKVISLKQVTRLWNRLKK